MESDYRISEDPRGDYRTKGVVMSAFNEFMENYDFEPVILENKQYFCLKRKDTGAVVFLTPSIGYSQTLIKALALAHFTSKVKELS